MVWILDLDGVVWLADNVIPGVPEAISRLREAGHTILFLTNNSSRRVGDLVEKFEGMGIPVKADELHGLAGAILRIPPVCHREVDGDGRAHLGQGQSL